MQTQGTLIAINTPAVDGAIVQAEDKHHIVRVHVSVAGGVHEMRGDWRHKDSTMWTNVTAREMRIMVVAGAAEFGAAGGELWETAQVVDRYLADLATQDLLGFLTGCLS
jgi:hypothetical protein